VKVPSWDEGMRALGDALEDVELDEPSKAHMRSLAALARREPSAMSAAAALVRTARTAGRSEGALHVLERVERHKVTEDMRWLRLVEELRRTSGGA
jgi:hypothetical protein